MTPATITRPADLRAEIEACAKSGVVFDMEEHTEGISAVGTALNDPLGRSVALSVSVPSTRFKGKKEIATQLLVARSAILAAFGTVLSD